MEFILQLIVYPLFAYAAYRISDKARIKNPDINIEPVLYAIGSVVFGFLWVMLFLAIKVSIYNRK